MSLRNISLPVFIERWRYNYWLIPTITTLVIAGMLPLMLSLDAKIFSKTISSSLFTGYSPEAARLILSSICTAVMTVIGVLFSITIVVVQQASAQFSPRVVEIFIKAKNSQFVLGLYVGTFVYGILLLRQIPATQEGIGLKIPQSAVSLAIILSLFCIAFLVQYVHFITHSIKSTRIIEAIIQDALKFLIDYKEFKKSHAVKRNEGKISPYSIIIKSRQHGYFQSYMPERIDKKIGHKNCHLTFYTQVGHYLREGDPLLKLESDSPVQDKDIKWILKNIYMGPERTHAQDVRYSLRQLTDIALRALSSSLNDPSTAIEALNGIWVILSKWLENPESEDNLKFENGLIISIVHQPFNVIIEHALAQIIVAANGHMMVLRKIADILESLSSLPSNDEQKCIQQYLQEVHRLFHSDEPGLKIFGPRH